MMMGQYCLFQVQKQQWHAIIEVFAACLTVFWYLLCFSAGDNSCLNLSDPAESSRKVIRQPRPFTTDSSNTHT